MREELPVGHLLVEVERRARVRRVVDLARELVGAVGRRRGRGRGSRRARPGTGGRRSGRCRRSRWAGSPSGRGWRTAAPVARRSASRSWRGPSRRPAGPRRRAWALASTTSVRSPGVPSAPAAGTLPTAQLTGPPVKLVPAGSATVTVPPVDRRGAVVAHAQGERVALAGLDPAHGGDERVLEHRPAGRRLEAHDAGRRAVEPAASSWRWRAAPAGRAPAGSRWPSLASGRPWRPPAASHSTRPAVTANGPYGPRRRPSGATSWSLSAAAPGAAPLTRRPRRAAPPRWRGRPGAPGWRPASLRRAGARVRWRRTT